MLRRIHAMKILVFISFLVSTNALCYKDHLASLDIISRDLFNQDHHDDNCTVGSIKNMPNIIERDDTICKGCRIVMDRVIDYRQRGASKREMVKYLKRLCHKLLEWPTVLCDEPIEMEINIVLYILDNRKNITGERICSILFMDKNCTDTNAEQWTIDIPPLKTYPPDDVINDKSKTFKILQISDIHWDRWYAIAKRIKCDLPLCCHGEIEDLKHGAGFWGEYYFCDPPWYSVLEFTDMLQKKDFNYLYFTGDVVSHDSWQSTQSNCLSGIQTFYNDIYKTFNNSKIFPILGEYDVHPAHLFSPKIENDINGISTEWLFNFTQDYWIKGWANYSIKNVKYGGFYSVLVKKGFRVIGINSNVCLSGNKWLIYDDVDPYGQLKWLVEQLTEAEKKQERVHLLSHVPPGEANCHRQWSDQFKKILQRFYHTISAQFNGHTHHDELRIIHHPEHNNSKRKMHLAFNGGSFTTYNGTSPNYKIYSVDQKTWKVHDFKTYISNLTKSNVVPYDKFIWRELYDFSSTYSFKLYDFKQLDTFKSTLKSNAQLRNKFLRLYNLGLKTTICDQKCSKYVRCMMYAADSKKGQECLSMMV